MWFMSFQELREHPKTLRLMRELKCGKPMAVGALHLLWGWCLEHAQDGDLSALDSGVIADAACWPDDPDAFLAALVTSGFVDRDEKGLRIHDWWEGAGKSLLDLDKHRESARKSAAKSRAIKKGDVDINLTSTQEQVDDKMTAVDSLNMNMDMKKKNKKDDDDGRARTRTHTRACARVFDGQEGEAQEAPTSGQAPSAEDYNPAKGRLVLVQVALPAFEAAWPEARRIIPDNAPPMMAEAVTRFIAGHPERERPAFWRELAERVRQTPLMRGEVPGDKGIFKMSSNWFFKLDHLLNALNGVYDDIPGRGAAPPGGRYKSPAQQRQDNTLAATQELIDEIDAEAGGNDDRD